MLCARVNTRVTAARPTTRVAPRPVRVVRAKPEQQALEDALKKAEECEGDKEKDGACAPEWDNVEEISAAISHKKDQNKATNASDPLEQYCGDNPDADECRVYED